MNIKKSSVRLYASPKAVITLFLQLPGTGRIEHILARVDKMDTEEVSKLLARVMASYGNRHRDLAGTFTKHFHRIQSTHPKTVDKFTEQKTQLVGAFFTKEYSIQAAALFNPSIAPHPDQQNLQPGEQRFIMSLRATGEGHISSILFKTGVIDKHGNIILDAESGFFSVLEKDELTTKISPAVSDTDYVLVSPASQPIGEKLIFPNAAAESMGMEDTRLVKFEHEGFIAYYGTYTAYDGKEIRTRLIETTDFSTFRVRTLSGLAISDKGMALFPQKINGKFVMISRQGGEKVSIMFSDDIYRWDESTILLEPQESWEFVQMGNCGSPVKTDRGWLLLTHGVGAMREYVISAVLLDLEDPAKVIGRCTTPILKADESERDGYVPNVVYTCGCLVHGELLVIPYAVSDSATGFATVPLEEILNACKS